MNPEWLKASGSRILGGVAGVVHRTVGKITISTPAHVGIDVNLMRILEAATDDLAIEINVNSIDTGTHVPASRHYHGCAVDINHVGPFNGPLTQATLSNHSAMALLHWLTEHGFFAGHEAGPYPAVLFGPVGCPTNMTQLDHSTHLHCSLHPLLGE